MKMIAQTLSTDWKVERKQKSRSVSTVVAAHSTPSPVMHWLFPISFHTLAIRLRTMSIATFSPPTAVGMTPTSMY